jgi:hypothetical protein
MGQLGLCLLFLFLAWHSAAALGWVGTFMGATRTDAPGYFRRHHPVATQARPTRLGIGLAAFIGVVTLALLAIDPAGHAIVEAFTLRPSALAGGQIWRLMTWAWVDTPGNLLQPSLAVGAFVVLAPPLERAFGAMRFLGGLLAGTFLVGIVASMAGAIFGGTLVGSLPLTFGLLAAWIPRVDRRWLASVMPINLQPGVILAIGLFILTWSAWATGAWTPWTATVFATFLGWLVGADPAGELQTLVRLQRPVQIDPDRPVDLERPIDLDELLS